MAVKKTLYQVLQVARNATPEVITAAYQARLRELGASAAPEVQSERTLLREAHDILSDPVRRKLYEDKLRDEAMRALSSGGEAVRARPANAAAPAVAVEGTGSSPMGWMIGVALVAAVAIAGGWMYLDHKRKSEALRLERERIAAEQKMKEETQQKALETVDWAKQQYEKNREDAEWRRTLAERDRDAARQRSEQQRAEQQQRYEDQRQQAEQRRVEQQRLAEERQNQYRAQQQLQREQRYLQELERNRPARF